MRIWFKMFENTHLLKDMTVTNETDETRTHKIFQAMVLGDKSERDEEITELYSVSGIAHVLAISGLHISIVGIYIYISYFN